MVRRFNYTGRVKIPRNRINIALDKDSNGTYFKVSINLDGFNFPSEAKLIIEPNYKGVYQRFYFGTIGDFKHPENTRLNELPETELAYFDVSVVDEQDNIGLILGKARGIAVSANSIPGNRLPLLYVNPADLGSQLWKLSFDTSDDGRPVLEINKNIPDMYEMARNDPKFISLVYPIAFRNVLQKLVELGDVDLEQDSWSVHWWKFISQILGVKTVPDFDSDNDSITTEQELWVDECVNEYCKKFKFFEKFTT